MKIVSLDDSKVCVPSVDDANQLMSALINYNCEAMLKKYDSFGEEDKPGDYTISFDNYDINVINQTNAETILHWFLSLGFSDIFIKKAGRVKQPELEQPEQVES